MTMFHPLRSPIEPNFGPHLTIDACGNYNLDNEKYIKSFLKSLANLLELKILAEPIIKSVTKEECPAGAGITGVVIISESHISIHTFPEKEFFFLDIFSCKKFNSNVVFEHIKNYFQVRYFEHNLINRGRLFFKK